MEQTMKDAIGSEGRAPYGLPAFNDVRILYRSRGSGSHAPAEKPQR